jgi:phage-related minor tail protein
MADETIDDAALANTLDGAQARIEALTISTNAFASAMTRAFTQATAGGRAFEDVLRSLALQISSMAVAAAFRPIATGIANGVGGVFASGASPSAQVSAERAGAAPPNITVQVQTPDLASFRRSEAYLTGQIARAVARGQRSL